MTKGDSYIATIMLNNELKSDKILHYIWNLCSQDLAVSWRRRWIHLKLRFTLGARRCSAKYLKIWSNMEMKRKFMNTSSRFLIGEYLSAVTRTPVHHSALVFNHLVHHTIRPGKIEIHRKASKTTTPSFLRITVFLFPPPKTTAVAK